MTGGRTEGTGEGMVLASNRKRGGAASETAVALIMVSSVFSAGLSMMMSPGVLKPDC